MVPIRGSTAECLRHFLDHLPSSTTRAGIAARKPIVTYCQCAPPTIRSWTKGQLPKGMMLIRVRYYLASVGYAITELDKLDPVIHDFGKLLADGKLDLVQVQDQLHYQDGHAILGMLHGSRLPTPDRFEIVRRIVAEQASPPVSKPPVATEPVAPAPPTGSPRRLLSAETRKHLIEYAARQIGEILPSVELLASTEFTDTERERFRELAGRFVVFNAAVSLYRLSGERARSIIDSE